MNGFQVMLDEKQSIELKRYIFEITREAVDSALQDVGADREFLSQKEMAEWIGVSLNTLIRYAKEGLPVIVQEGRNLYSKKEVTKYLLAKQKGGLDE